MTSIVPHFSRDTAVIFFLAAAATVLPTQTLHAQAVSLPPELSVSIAPSDCRYSLATDKKTPPVLVAGIAAEIDHKWLHSSDYPKCTATESGTHKEFGPPQEWTVKYSGLSNAPDLSYTLRLYPLVPLAEISATVINSTGHAIEVQAIRAIESSRSIDLGGPESQDRVLSDSFSENRPAVRIHDLADATNQMHRGVGSQLIFNRQSHHSFFVGALSSDRFLTILRVHLAGSASAPSIQSYEVDSAGTTELAIENSLRTSPQEDRIELSLPVAPGETLSSEHLLIGLGVGADVQRQLEAYGNFIRVLHHPPPPQPTPIGWWSWTAYYFGLNESAALTNAQWMAQNLKPLGYNFFHIDEGYQYARGEYATPDAALFPHGMAALEHQVALLGLTPGIWTAPFEVGERSYVYQNHPDWLLKNAQGKPIHIGNIHGKENLYVLDATHPGAQDYLRYTYTTMSRDWGLRYFKLDFMDDTVVEGRYYRPHTTALEAQRIGLALIRSVVGSDVLLDKDGSVMLTPVGLVNEGRISQDTGHTFAATKDAATGIAARFYMNHNFYTSDPDAFSVSTQTLPGHWHGGETPLSLEEARASVALSAVSGGMYEIGDDLPTLGSEPERLALVKNRDLLDMARLGRASTPLDLMDYLPEDEQPSIFFLREDPRQSILTVFNWTDKPRMHTLRLADFFLPAAVAASDLRISDIFSGAAVFANGHGALVVEQPPHSVRVFKLQNSAGPSLHRAIVASCAGELRSGSELTCSVNATDRKEPVLGYEWDFGDGVTAASTVAPSPAASPGPMSIAGLDLATTASVRHAFTEPRTYSVRVTATFLNGVTSEFRFDVAISGGMNTDFDPALKRRFQPPQ